MEYTVVKIIGQNGREARFAKETSEILTELGSRGWRLVTVDQFWAYFERPKVV